MTKLLIDECLSAELASMARERGHHEASHVAWIGKAGWKDWELKQLLLDEDWVLVTWNAKDFRGPRESPGTAGQFAGVVLHAGLICINGPVGMDLALQRELFSEVLDELDRDHAGLEELDLAPEDDIAPGSIQPVVAINQDGERQIELMRWGFKLSDRLLFNARSEGIESSKFWKDSFEERRCIVPADAVFEWQQTDKGKKKPKYEIALSGQEPFGMAGVWKLWKNPRTNEWERAFAVITGEPNELVQPIHDRMTTFLEHRDYAEYLSPAERPPVHLLRILPASKLKARLVDATSIINKQVNLFDSQ